MICVIADDITGAAEIAGIAHRYGLRSRLLVNPGNAGDADVVVIATDARSYGAEEAAAMTASVVRLLPSDAILFRKTDSALRGNVEAEIGAVIASSAYDEAIYMPANPSKGRIIRDGVYYIDDTPIHETDFRFDPEFPARSSSLEERFPSLRYANATSKDDVDAVVRGAMARHWLLAGAADLFCSLLEYIHNLPSATVRSFDGLSEESSRLIVCGSTQSKMLSLGLRIESMPMDVFYEQAPAVTWVASIIERYRKEMSVVLTIGDKEVRQGKAAAVYLRTAMAETTCALLSAHMPDELVIEGGATAFAIMQQLPWHAFNITDEIAPGVVRMTIEGAPHPVHVTLKPGSYSWGNLWK